MKKAFCAALVASCFLMSCSEKTPALVLSPLPSMQASLSPSLTATATNTIVSTPSLMPTSMPTRRIPVPTTPAEATEQAVADRHCVSQDYPNPAGFLPSKSGKLMAFVCWLLSEKDISITKVIALDGSITPVQASYQKDYLMIDDSEVAEHINGINSAQMYYLALYPVEWSADDRFVYLVRQSPASGVRYAPQVLGMIRLDVETGKVAAILEPHGSYYVNLSTDADMLLSVAEFESPLTVKVQNLVTGDVVNIHLDTRFNQAGHLILSPDGKKIVISAMDEKGTSILVADLLSGAQKYLITEGVDDLFPLSWLDDQTLYMLSYQDKKLSFFYMDILTEQTRVAPTATTEPRQ